MSEEPVARNSDIATVAVKETGNSYRLAPFSTGKVVAAPVIRGTIGDDSVIDAGFSRKEAYTRAVAP